LCSNSTFYETVWRFRPALPLTGGSDPRDGLCPGGLCPPIVPVTAASFATENVPKCTVSRVEFLLKAKLPPSLVSTTNTTVVMCVRQTVDLIRYIRLQHVNISTHLISHSLRSCCSSENKKTPARPRPRRLTEFIVN